MLSRYETGFSDFGDFLASCGDQFKVRFWRHITNCKGKYTDSTADRKQAFPIVYGYDKEYKSHMMWRLATELCNILDEYVGVMELKTTAIGQRMRAKICEREGFLNWTRRINNVALEKALKEAESQQYFMEWSIFFDQHAKRDKQEERKLLEQSEDALDRFYLINKLKSLIENLVICREFEKPIDEGLRKKIELAYSLIPEENIPLVIIQKHAIEYLLDRNMRTYREFKTTYLNHVRGLKSEQEYLLITLINALILMPNPTEETRQEYISLYTFGIENKILGQNGSITGLQFDNIIFIAEAMGEYKLIKQTHDRLAHLIGNKKERKRSTLLSKAYALFGEGKYADALVLLEVLGKARDLPYFFIMRRNILVLKCVYEKFEDKQEAYNVLRHAGSSLRKMAYRFEKDGTINKTKKQCLYNYSNIMCRIANQGNISTKEELLATVKGYNELLVETKYVLEKINEK